MTQLLIKKIFLMIKCYLETRATSHANDNNY